MFADPNDNFDPDEYCHSPWYERCCREERSVGSLKEKGDWDELWFKMMPVKSINADAADNGPNQSQGRLPRNVFVGHLNLNTVSLRYMADAVIEDTPPLHVMVLLKV